MLAPKLRKSAAYPVKIRATWAAIQPPRSTGLSKFTGCCAMDEANVNRKTSGKMKMPGESVRYRQYISRKTDKITKASNDSDSWMDMTVRLNRPLSMARSVNETK